MAAAPARGCASSKRVPNGRAHAARDGEVGEERASVCREIMDLAIKYGLMSRETSVSGAVERRATPVVGEIVLQRTSRLR